MNKPFITSVEVAGPFEVYAERYVIKAGGRKAPVTGGQVKPITARAASSQASDSAVHMIDDSGLFNRDFDSLLEHNNKLDNMWVSEKGQNTRWVEFDLGAVFNLELIKIWNFNEKWQTDRGVKRADISIWTESGGWKKILDDFEFSEAEGGNDYDTPVLVKLDGVEAEKVRFEELVNFGDKDHVGLGEVQFFEVRGPEATHPRPADSGDFGAVGGSKLAWAPGSGVKAYDVYFGNSPEELKLLGRVNDAGCGDLPALERYKKYYWRVDSVTSGGSIVKGKLWSFSSGQLVGWYKFDENSGDAVADSSGKGHHGTVVSGKPVWDTGGKFGGCLNFNETYGISIPSEMFSNISTTMTLSVWVNGDRNQGDHSNVILQAGSGDDGIPYIVTVGAQWRDNGSLSFKTGRDGADTLNFSASVDQWAGRWNHYVFVKDADSGLQRIYLNGKLVAEDRRSSAPIAGIETARIGIAPDRFGDQYIGKLDDLRIYSYALSDDEVGAIYTGGLAKSEPQNWTAVLVIFVLALGGAILAGRKKKAKA